jgi:hypothetical protein
MKLIKHSLAAFAALGFLIAVSPTSMISPAEAHCGCFHKKKWHAPAVASAPAPAVTVVAPPQPVAVVVPQPPLEPLILSYGDPAELAASRLGCPLVHDALLLKSFKDGQTQYHWRLSDWWYMPPPEKPGARLCNHNGKLAWWYPPQPKTLETSTSMTGEVSSPHTVAAVTTPPVAAANGSTSDGFNQ